ncbi:A24 family peptidase [Paragemmobacter aquarius]|nr:prepilin peptidase [Gemmobacter aquarius]
MDVIRLWQPNGLSTDAVTAMLASVFFLSALLYAAHRDLRTLTIPNGLVAALLLGWGLLAPLAGLAPRDMTLSLGAAAMVFFATVALYAVGWLGGGDSKLMTVSALWIGAGQVVPFLMATMLAGAAIALALVTLRLLPRALARPLQGTGRLARILPLVRTEIPYALAILLGTMTVFPATFWAGAL